MWGNEPLPERPRRIPEATVARLPLYYRALAGFGPTAEVSSATARAVNPASSRPGDAPGRLSTALELETSNFSLRQDRCARPDSTSRAMVEGEQQSAYRRRCSLQPRFPASGFCPGTVSSCWPPASPMSVPLALYC